ncbi:hypothetical protein [Wenjunlia tyrosinilytica]|nr:hypothetical protein [Wenjunlia tyrosinilytica]
MQPATTRESTCCGQGHAGQAVPGGSGPSAGTLERPRYFPRQLITPDDLTLEADYFRDRMRRHNVHLHGWGVVCGALVCVVPVAEQPQAGGAVGNGAQTVTEPWLVRVQPGYVLGPYGDEIVIDAVCEVSLRNGSAGEPADPRCGEVYVNEPEGPLYIAVRYRQGQVRPVPAQPAGCGCSDVSCEYSRFRDGFEFGVLDHCPGSHRPDGEARQGEEGNPFCPPCPDSAWVVLAEVTVDADGTVTRIDNCSCRRIVSSTRDDWRRCGSSDADRPPQGGAETAKATEGSAHQAAKGTRPAGDGGGRAATTAKRRASGRTRVRGASEEST